MSTEQHTGTDRTETVIIGAGQAGLATAYHLRRRDAAFTILDAAQRVGDSWRRRWDSLRLFTPSQYDSLPGLPFPLPKGSYPTKDQMADYLEDYSRKFGLPVRLETMVRRLARNSAGFMVETDTETIHADRVVVATGTNPLPKYPAFSAEADPDIFQIHSSAYINPDPFPDGPVLVVGAGTSGVEIAIELSRTRKAYIAGNPTFHIPDPLFRYAGKLYWWFASNVLTVRTPIGRKAGRHIVNGGGPLVNVSESDLGAAGVVRLPRVTGMSGGMPQVEDGRVIPVASIVWATGFRPDFSWIDLPVTGATGWPVTDRGVSPTVPGIYFMGMRFQYGLTSGLVGGVGRDASVVVKRILGRG